MDPMDILGSLLGGKMGGGRSGGGGAGGGGGLGGQILKEILGGGRSAPATRSTGTSPGEIASQAKGLEDLLNVAIGRSTGGRQAPQQPMPQQQPIPQQQPMPQRQPQQPDFRGAGNSMPQPRPGNYPSRPAPPTDQNDQALVLVRAMINAAKSDGQISQQEQQEILSRLSDSSPDTIQFLREEFSKPLDVREFAWSVPMGMEQQVYLLSLATIELDANQEAQYLRDLAHGLRLTPDTCNQLHGRVGAPEIF
jgi:uncharacterized membrane protein YebE (DUF533 family)